VTVTAMTCNHWTTW